MLRDRYSVFVGLIFLALIAFASIRTLTGHGGGEATLGIDRQPAHWPLPEFAVPEAAGHLEGDANIAQDDCESGSLPCPSGASRRAACGIPTAEAIRVCELFDRPLVLSFWFMEGACPQQQDIVNAAFLRLRGGVNFLSIDTGGDREQLRELVRENGWQMPVGYDRDGAVAALYHIGGCPTFAYSYPGGTLESASAGPLTLRQLERRVRGLVTATSAAEGN